MEYICLVFAISVYKNYYDYAKKIAFQEAHMYNTTSNKQIWDLKSNFAC